MLVPVIEPRTTIHDLLASARRGLRRLSAAETQQALERGAVVIDTRSEMQRRAQGIIPGSRHHPLSVLEWRMDPSSDHRDPDISLDDWVVVVCAEGYSSSLAAARLQALGFRRATDLIDGFQGWLQGGLPVQYLEDRPERSSRSLRA